MDGKSDPAVKDKIEVTLVEFMQELRHMFGPDARRVQGPMSTGVFVPEELARWANATVEKFLASSAPPNDIEPL